jgi:phosphocarrier protein
LAAPAFGVRVSRCRLNSPFRKALNNFKELPMAQRIAVIGSTSGLHARPASLIAELVRAYPFDINICLEGADEVDVCDASSILSLMSLGAVHGDKVVLQTDGEGAEDVLDALVRELERDHDAVVR